jgi:(heptosyl)LPS beta-1,4-glucosyltransferase
MAQKENGEEKSKGQSLSAIIITKNESKNIQRCLESLQFCNEVLVFDSGSTDNTVEICNQFNNVVCKQTEWFGYSETKQRAANEAKNNWVLWIDADETVPTQLAEEIQSLNFSEYLYGFPRKTFIGNLWVNHGGWYPGIVWRLFHKNYVQFDGKKLHEGLEFKNNLKQHNNSRKILKNDLLHYSYVDLHDYFFKMCKYSISGAEEASLKGKKGNLSSVVFEPLFAGIKFYFIKSGFRMGFAGIVFAVGTSVSTFFRYAQLWWWQKYGRL